MCKRIKKFLIISILVYFFIPLKINADTLSINDLIIESKIYNNRIVKVEGESIGEELHRGNYSWININDTTNSIGIYMKKNDAKKVKVYGGYNKFGDTIEVEGKYNKSCIEHSGDTDIHAINVSVVKDGIKIEPELPSYKAIIAIGLIMISFSVSSILYKKNKNN